MLRRRFAIIVAAGGFLLGAGAVAEAALFPPERAFESGLRSAAAPAEIAGFYAARRFQPIWTEGGRPNAAGLRLIKYLDQEPRDQAVERRRTQEAGLADLIQASARGRASEGTLEARLSTAFVALVADDGRTSPGNDLIRVDPQVQRPTPGELLASVAAGEGSAAAVDAAFRRHPEFDRLSAAYRRWRAEWGALPPVSTPHGPTLRLGDSDDRVARLRGRLGLGRPGGVRDQLDPVFSARLYDFQKWHGIRPSGELDRATVEALNTPPAEYDRLIRLNLDRLRALPARPGKREVFVNIAGASLTATEGGRPVRTMNVVVGRPDSPNPDAGRRDPPRRSDALLEHPPGLGPEPDRAGRAARRARGVPGARP
ncbi:MAG: hypothetical protein ACK4JY_13430 [Brevundimonas sp.]